MGDTNHEKFLRALIGPFQDAEDTLQDMFVNRNVNTAAGVQLDMIGKIVGRPRNGITDDEIYRRYIRAQIATNKSDGTINEILTIAGLVIFNNDAYYHLINSGVATYTLILENVVTTFELALILIGFMKLATSAGVRPILEFWMSDEVDMFEFESFVSGSGIGKGLGSTLDASVGGRLASALD